MDRRDVFVPSGCSKHPGELLQHFCRSCCELLCFRCILTSEGTHLEHKVIHYKVYLLERERQAIRLLRQLNEIRTRAEHFKTLLASYKVDFNESYRESEVNLGSFKTVKEEMQKWQQDLSRGLEAKKLSQIRILDEAIEAANRGEISDNPVDIRLPKVTIHVQLKRKLQEKVQELVPKSFSSFIRGNSDYSRTASRYYGESQYRAPHYAKESLHDSLSRPRSPTFSELTSDSMYESISDEVSILSDTTTVTDTLKIGASAYSLMYEQPSSESSYDSLEPLYLEADSARQNRPKLVSTESSTSPFSLCDDQNVKPEHSDPKPVETPLVSMPKEDPQEYDPDNTYELCDDQPEHSDPKPVETPLVSMPKEDPQEYDPDELYEDLSVGTRPSSEEEPEQELYDSIDSGQPPVVVTPAESLQGVVSTHSALDQRKSLEPHPLSSGLLSETSQAIDPIYDDVVMDGHPLYDSLDYSEINPTHNSEHEPYARKLPPFTEGKLPLTFSYQQLDQPDNKPATYTTPSQLPLPVRQVIISPANIILASCFSERLYETVSLSDVCIASDGIMVFSDTENDCLRCLLGIREDSKTITKRFKDNLQPRALAYDSCNQKIIMATDKGLYEVECSTHFSKMKEKKLNKEVDLIPLSIACSTVLGSKKKGASSLLYTTIWPTLGDNCVYRFDSNGQFESKICSADFSNKNPFGIDYMKEYLVVSFLDDGSLMKMSHRGDPLWDASVDARKSGILNQPFGVAILPRTEYIAVTEAGAHRVSIFSDQGKLVLRLGEKGSDRGKFDTPRGIAVRLFRELVVVDFGNKRIQIFSLASLGLPSNRSANTSPSEYLCLQDMKK